MIKKGQMINNDTAQKTEDLATPTPQNLEDKGVVLRNGKQYLLNQWNPSWYNCFQSGGNSWMGNICDYDKRNISMVICDTDIPYNNE